MYKRQTYGSVQKLFTRDSDLVVLCEDKVLRVLGNKDAVFNADGNPQLTANQNVLGQSMPFVGEYGISKNPESFVSEAYRSYFTDKQRGTVMRLSKDGLTPISLHGMKDYFRDNLKNESLLLGSYDKKKDEYNVTMPHAQNTVTFNENVKGWTSFKSFVPEGSVGCSGDYYTFNKGKIYKHHAKDVSEENSATINNIVYSLADGTNPNNYADGKYFYITDAEYNMLVGSLRAITGTQGNATGVNATISEKVGQYRDGVFVRSGYIRIWNDPLGGGIHGRWNASGTTSDGSVSNADDWAVGDVIVIPGSSYRNDFYNQPYSSTIDVLLNDAPSNIKTYNTVDYEGTEGWTVASVKTDQSEGTVNSFVEKEGKYYNYIQGINSDIDNNTDFASADIQGGGILLETPDIDEDDGNSGVVALTHLTLKLNSINTSMQVGDTLYYVKAVNLNSTTASNVVKYGPIDSINRDLNEIKVIQINYQAGVNEFEQNDFLMFAKDKRANKSSVSGYYADLNFENNSVEKAELFTVASEIQESSK